MSIPTIAAALVERRWCSRNRLVGNVVEHENAAEDGMDHAFFSSWKISSVGHANMRAKVESQFQARHIAVAFDGVDALAGDAGGLGQLLLGPAEGDAEFLDAICDGLSHVKLTFQLRVA